jgi:hypothetical protein
MKDKKSLPQMIILGALVAVLVGYFAVTFMGSKSKPSPAKTTAQKKEEPAAQKQAAQNCGDQAGQEETAKSEADIIATEVSIPASVRRDPFAPTMDIRTKMPNIIVPHKTNTTRVAMNSGDLRPIIPNIGPLPPFGTGPTPVHNQGNNLAGNIEQTARIEEPTTPKFMLTGIITGRTNVAIIRLGEGRFICKEGQTINGSYKVVSVSQDGVLLSRDGRSVFLKLGGEGNAS